MLPPENRLKKEKEIKRALAGKIAAGGAALSLRAAATDLPAARFCFVVSKRVSKKARRVIWSNAVFAPPPPP